MKQDEGNDFASDNKVIVLFFGIISPHISYDQLKEIVQEHSFVLKLQK